ncbi:MAG: DUF1638 domain-containing protein [Dehalococcoidia bacterium]
MPEQPTADAPRVVIACGSIKPELEALKPDDGTVEVRYLDQNLHRMPDRMPGIIQAEIEKVKGYAWQIVLGYGLCSNGVVGLVAPEQGLIIPRVHDCITLFLGSRVAYEKAFRDRPGTYYLTPAWIEEKKDPLGYLEAEYVPKLGRELAEWGLKEELKHYTHIVLIDTGVKDVIPLRERAMENARFLEKEFDEIAGTHDYFRRILFGPYPEDDFVILQAGEEVRQKAFFQ